MLGSAFFSSFFLVSSYSRAMHFSNSKTPSCILPAPPRLATRCHLDLPSHCCIAPFCNAPTWRHLRRAGTAALATDILTTATAPATATTISLPPPLAEISDALGRYSLPPERDSAGDAMTANAIGGCNGQHKDDSVVVPRRDIQVLPVAAGFAVAFFDVVFRVVVGIVGVINVVRGKHRANGGGAWLHPSCSPCPSRPPPPPPPTPTTAGPSQ
jgi:hypothetical protein